MVCLDGVKGKCKMPILELLSNLIAPGKNGVKDRERILILTPVKNASVFIQGYCRRLQQLTYPHKSISVGLLESDSNDSTYRALQAHIPALRRQFRPFEHLRLKFFFIWSRIRMRPKIRRNSGHACR